MERNNSTPRVLTAVLAALLIATPPAGAAKTKKIVKLDGDVRRLMSEGLGQLQRGKTTEAVTAFNKAVRKKGTVSSYFLLGWAHYQRGFKLGSVEAADREDAQSAVEAYSMALSLDPKLSELPDPSRLYFSLALCYEALDSYDEALNAYKMALSAAPSRPLIAVHAARLRLKMKNPGKALSNIEIALNNAEKNGRTKALRDQVRRDPAFAPLIADAACRRALGIADAQEDGTMIAADFRSEEMRDAVRDTPAPAPPAQDSKVLDKIAQGNLQFKFRRYISAAAFYNQALDLDAQRPTLGNLRIAAVYERLGAAHNKIGQSDAATVALEKSLELDGRSSSARYQLALAYAMSGKTGTALETLQKSFKAASDAAELRRLVMMAKTDVELEAVRDLPGFKIAVASVSKRVALR